MIIKAIEKELLDQLLSGRDPQELFSKDGLIDALKKALSERLLNTELDEHLGSEAEKGCGNNRNGSSARFICEINADGDVKGYTGYSP